MKQLYKYKPFSTEPVERQRTLDNLRNNQIWYCNPDYFNDIFDTSIYLDECRRLYDYKTLKQEDEQILDRETISKLKSMLNGCIGILSLTTKCINNVMWAHYADYHKGFCMGFDVKYQDKNILTGTNSGLQCIKVIYDDEYIDSTRIIIDNKKSQEIFLRKSKDWEYEDEYRVVLNLIKVEEIEEITDTLIKYYEKIGYKTVVDRLKYIRRLVDSCYLHDCIDLIDDEMQKIKREINGRDQKICVLDERLNLKGGCYKYPGKLSSIIFGYRMELEDKLEIKAAVEHNNKNIKYSRIILKENSYELDIVEEEFK